MKSQRRIYFYFGLAFLVFAVITVIIQVSREKRHKVNELKAKMQAYAIMTDDFLGFFHDTVAVANMLPDSLRFTLIDAQGNVVLDNTAHSSINTIDHYDRPEITAARLYGDGYAIRQSNSVHEDYLYYAYRCNSGDYIRLALPYRIDIRDVIGHEALMMYGLALALIVILLMLMDKTGQLRHSKKLISNEKERNKRLKQEMTNNIAHELKTPVASIRGYLESLNDNPDIDVKKRRHFIDRALAQTLRLSSLIQDIGLITKLEESSQLFAKEQVDIREIIAEACSELDLQIQEAGDVVRCELPDTLPLSGNRSLIYAIFRNLIENVLHHAGKGLEIVVRIDKEAKSDGYNFILYDTGRGIPEKDLDRIFDRFVRLDDGRDCRSGGTGLGIAIVKHAVQFHGGTINAENRPEGGLLFRFSLNKERAAYNSSNPKSVTPAFGHRGLTSWYQIQALTCSLPIVSERRMPSSCLLRFQPKGQPPADSSTSMRTMQLILLFQWLRFLMRSSRKTICRSRATVSFTWFINSGSSVLDPSTTTAA